MILLNWGLKNAKYKSPASDQGAGLSYILKLMLVHYSGDQIGSVHCTINRDLGFMTT
jgi:hypothetical protein